eukprot:Awhi_evm1s11307
MNKGQPKKSKRSTPAEITNATVTPSLTMAIPVNLNTSQLGYSTEETVYDNGAFQFI